MRKEELNFFCYAKKPTLEYLFIQTIKIIVAINANQSVTCCSLKFNDAIFLLSNRNETILIKLFVVSSLKNGLSMMNTINKNH